MGSYTLAYRPPPAVKAEHITSQPQTPGSLDALTDRLRASDLDLSMVSFIESPDVEFSYDAQEANEW